MRAQTERTLDDAVEALAWANRCLQGAKDRNEISDVDRARLRELVREATVYTQAMEGLL